MALVPGGAPGDSVLSSPQYKVLSVLPGSGMGIAVSTPSTQKVSGGPGAREPGVAQSRGRAWWGASPPPSLPVAADALLLSQVWVRWGLRPAGREGRAGAWPLGGRGCLPPAPREAPPDPAWSPAAFPPCQPLVFGAMVHRDEAFETIFSQYVKITAAAASGSDS